MCRFEPSSGAVTICKDSKRYLNDSFFGGAPTGLVDMQFRLLERTFSTFR